MVSGLSDIIHTLLYLFLMVKSWFEREKMTFFFFLLLNLGVTTSLSGQFYHNMNIDHKKRYFGSYQSKLNV